MKAVEDIYSSQTGKLDGCRNKKAKLKGKLRSSYKIIIDCLTNRNASSDCASLSGVFVLLCFGRCLVNPELVYESRRVHTAVFQLSSALRQIWILNFKRRS